MTAETTWFRNPHDGSAGTLNLCFNALDRQVIRGHATEPALIGDGVTLDFAGVLEQVSALAGALAALGVGRGDSVAEHLADPVDRVLFTLAASRLGAILGAPGPRLLATSHDGDDEGTDLRLLRGVDVVDATRDLAWEMAIKAGREDPAACVEVAGDAAVFVVGVDVVEARDALGHDSAPARIHAILAAGGPLDVRSDLG